MKDAQFEGQTKGKLGNTEVRTIVESIVQEKLSLYLADLNNEKIASTIVARPLRLQKLDKQQQKQRSWSASAANWKERRWSASFPAAQARTQSRTSFS